MQRKYDFAIKVCPLFFVVLLNLGTIIAFIASSTQAYPNGQSSLRRIKRLATTDKERANQIALDRCREYANYRFSNYTVPDRRNTTDFVDDGRNKSVLNCSRPRCDGKPAGIGQYPHMVLLFHKENITDEEDNGHQCGGTLISDQFILSSAYCSVDPNGNQVKWAGLGLISRAQYIADTTKRNIFRIKYYINHPSYEPGTFNNDIALYKLVKAIALTPFIRPICIHEEPLASNDKVGIMRWGRTVDTDYDEVPKTDWLLNEIIQQQEKRKCQWVVKSGYYSNYWDKWIDEVLSDFDESKLICAGPTIDTEDVCKGDLGGPMQKRKQDIDCMWVQDGITTQGPKSCRLKAAKLYTRISFHLPWIQKIVWPEFSECYG